MNKHELELLREIQLRYATPLMEDIQNFTFAIIEPTIPSKNAEYETIINIYGEKQAMMRGRAGVRATGKEEWVDATTGQRAPYTGGDKPPSSMPNAKKVTFNQEICPMCGGEGELTIGDGIKYHIARLKGDIEGEGDISTDFTYKKGLRSQTTEASGRKRQSLENEIDTLEHDINYLEDTLKRYQESGKADEEVECPLCTGWQWEDIPQYKDASGRFNASTAEKQKWPWEIFMDWLWKTFEGAGLNPVYGHVDPIAAGFKDKADRYGADLPSPTKTEPIGPQKHVIISVESLGTTKGAVHRALIDVFENAEPSFFKIEPYPNKETMDRFEMAVARSMDRATENQLKQIEGMEQFIEDNQCFYVTARIRESRFGEELGLPTYEITTPLDITKLLARVKPTQKFKCRTNGEHEWEEPEGTKKAMCPICAEAGAESEGYPVSAPLSVGEVPPRTGEWYPYAKSIKQTGELARSARSKKAHKKTLETKTEIRKLLASEHADEEIIDIMLDKYRENMASMGRKSITKNMLERYRNTVTDTIKEVKAEEERKSREEKAAEYPGSKYAHWDNLIDDLAEALNSNPVAVELAVSKYMDSIDRFPKPFDFDRLNVDDAVEAMNLLKAIDPGEIDSLIVQSEEFLSGNVTESWILDQEAARVTSDLGSNRANAIYGAIKEIKEDALRPLNKKPFFKESPEFSRVYSKASKLFDSLLECAIPLTKVAKAVPIIEDAQVFKPNSNEFWANIFYGSTNGDPLIKTNAIKIGNFFRRKIDGTLFESLKRLYDSKTNPVKIAKTLDSRGRNADL